MTAQDLFVPRQTNTALYMQLHDAGHAVDDILRVQKAYRVACAMFNGRYRKTGRPFICHAVGAASSVAHFDKDLDLVLAAMFHASYDSAQYPDGKSSRRTETHRKWLEQKLGPRVEGLVARVGAMKFDTGDPERLVEKGVPAGDEDILFLVLAHDVDDLADGGLAFAPKYGRSIESRVAACAILARRIGRESLAATIEAYGSRYGALGWAAALEDTRLEGFRIAPNVRNYLKLRRDKLRGGRVEVL
ncbi:MAG: HD domain-containing protein [Mesorhizobium sp.]|uniref:HD domain-containing protein n=1 Tax=unclassified Mesorhizobium TaxID=325217 RepID=UPI000F74D004|nr:MULTISPECIES: HD domain-containing protein [unclassified Mesorhizobium]RVD69447.1 HD domain-containing protein [Mesorhizobium sp. M4A.F.Ca.ET.029.04.2.1]AZO47591.1 HD domain-containing protein [Mesorhizobium sp. M4B.F.Ca.ET.058.02.1.1]RUX42896.1 HD domain-containing protein [Mesorhizobium sp. M4A.F.Ca.ET.050.02.1.1]RVC46819.1 HD domain-containing protein [Mesorhizobium sp. M4A.F.Ca.ET.090.04.2.1]RVC80383.1 HD domain-containing protein [Mesorhizobium sp. M4A.F.Ca.ET.022.05.2.1]